MKQIMKQVGMMVACVFALGLPDDGRAADANPPERMTYQGYLVDGNGAPLGNSAPTNYDVVFRVYADKQAGTALWAEQQTITVDKGYFSVLLGEGSSTASGEPGGNLSAAFDGLDASDRFIGITVETGSGATEIAPRLRLVASPYAYTATQARRLTDGSGNANFYKDGTTLKLGVGSTPTLTLTEAGSKKRAAPHVVAGGDALDALNPGGIEIMDCTEASFRTALTASNHTVKRALTDPRIFSGVGNAYSDEILHRARLSPILQT